MTHAHFLWLAATLSLSALFTACDDEATTIGGSVMPRQDNVSTDQFTFPVTTHSVRTGAVVANANRCYLGSIVDPGTGAVTTSGYLAQFHIQEDYRLPERKLLLTDAQGQLLVDSCVLRIQHDRYFGDSLTTMKVHIQELDTARAMDETTVYYSDFDPSQFLSTNTAQQKTVTYSALDQTKSATVLNNRSIYRSISLQLSNAFGVSILNKYYAQPAYFKNSYEFARHVCAGFAVSHAGGLGVMINPELTTLDIYFRQHTTNAAGKDTLVGNILRIGSTEEVIQNTHIDQELPEHLLDSNLDYTYLKSPAGIHTEATLPIADIVGGTHQNDTINGARLTLRTLNEEKSRTFNLPIPTHILMLPASKVEDFFASGALPDNVTSYLTTYNTSGYYQFDNIAPLVSVLRQTRNAGAGISPQDTEVQRQAKWQQWEQQNPNWNKVAILPVSAEYSTQTSIYGTTSKTLQSVRHQFGLSSVRIEGGKSPLTLSVIYSRFQQ